MTRHQPSILATLMTGRALRVRRLPTGVGALALAVLLTGCSDPQPDTEETTVTETTPTRGNMATENLPRNVGGEVNLITTYVAPDNSTADFGASTPQNTEGAEWLGSVVGDVHELDGYTFEVTQIAESSVWVVVTSPDGEVLGSP